MGTEFLYTMLLAFVGGIILNVMPCVLPVLTMKVFHLVKHGQDDPRSNKLHGLAYSAGIVATLMFLAVVVAVLRASGEVVGWGMQFQNPSFVAALVVLIFVFGLNALSVFEFTLSFGGGGEQKDGLMGSFVNGIVAAIMSTPCSAPFLGTAAAVALGSEAAWWETQLLFLSIGIGLASPFLLISFVPALARILPKPGAWMETFKHLMGFTLMGAAIWLFSVLKAQIAESGSTWFLVFLLVIGISVWAIDRFGGLMESARRRIAVRIIAVGVCIGAGFAFIDFTPKPKVQAAVSFGAPVVKDNKINWVPFEQSRIDHAAAQNRPIFADFTADWCANCKTNEKLFIEVESVRQVFTKTQILPMMADWTNEDEHITKALKALGRSAIPAYVIYFPDGTYDLLPEVITTEMVIERLQAASAKYPPTGFKTIPAPQSAMPAAPAPTETPKTP